jgi:hypothetical protein
MIIKISVFALVFLCSLIHSDVDYPLLCGSTTRPYKDRLVFIGDTSDCSSYGTAGTDCYKIPLSKRDGRSFASVNNIVVDNADGFLIYENATADGKICSTSACADNNYCSPNDVSITQGNVSNIHGSANGSVFFIQIGVAFVFESINFYNCVAGMSGGVVYLDGSGSYSTLTVTYSSFTECRAVQHKGGAIYISKYTADKLISPSLLFLHLKYLFSIPN